MLEALLRILHPRWRATFEDMPVLLPARGVIDCVLDDNAGPDVVAVEAESDIRRFEQPSLRSATAKADLLPSSERVPWSFVTADPERRPAHRATHAPEVARLGQPIDCSRLPRAPRRGHIRRTHARSGLPSQRRMRPGPAMGSCGSAFAAARPTSLIVFPPECRVRA